ncbi:major facilitator superfamily domain-containing protein [Mycena metata]|uniref:Major facilitator superfamily domain-containing protein n=1 Tax=Mycena metata TaxID=1033252 RepID=A0AAD7HQE7_9AGAR|nr:major facilitator superfamily domain-containing protein [Mycena metata]
MAKKMTISDHSSSQPSAHTQPVPKYKSNEKQTEELPDGGLQAWATVAGGFMLYVAGLGYRNVLHTAYINLTAPSPAEIAFVALQPFIVGDPNNPPTGGSAAAKSLFNSYSIFLTQGVGMGIGLGLTFLPALAVTAHHFSRRRGLAMGIMTSGASIGGIIFPIMLNNLLFRHGFAIGVRATAALITALMYCLVEIVESGLIVYLAGSLRIYSSVPISEKSTSLEGVAANHNKRPTVYDFRGGWGLYHAGNILPELDFNFELTFCSLSCPPVFYLQLYAIKQGIREKIAFDTITLINAGGVLGRVIPNFLADRVGSFNVIIPVIFLAAGCVLAMLAVALGSGGIIAVSLLYGIMNAGFVSISPALLAELSTDRSEIGIRMGLWFSFTAAAAMAGQPLSGALILGNFRWSTVFAGVCLCVGGSLSILSRLFFLRRRLRDGGAAL